MIYRRCCNSRILRAHYASDKVHQIFLFIQPFRVCQYFFNSAGLGFVSFTFRGSVLAFKDPFFASDTVRDFVVLVFTK